LKKEFEELCQDLGLSMTSAFTVFAKAVVRHRGIPFELMIDQPNAETRAAIEEARAAKKNPSKGKTYTDVDVMMRELLS